MNELALSTAACDAALAAIYIIIPVFCTCVTDWCFSSTALKSFSRGKMVTRGVGQWSFLFPWYIIFKLGRLSV